MPLWNISRKGGLGYLINAQRRKLEIDIRSNNRHNRDLIKKNNRTLKKARKGKSICF